MIYVANQLFKTHPVGIEQHFAACSGLSQSISEEFDRGTELQAQTWQQACESWGRFYSSIWQVKNPQEFFMLLSAHLHASAEQTQHYLHSVHSLTQQIQEKMFALEQTFSPMMTETLIDITPTTTSEKLITEPIIESKVKTSAEPAVKILPKIELTPAPAKKPKAKIQGAKPAIKMLKNTPKPTETEVETAAQPITKTTTPLETTTQGQTSEKKRIIRNSSRSNKSTRIQN